LEQEEYQREGIAWEFIEFPDNQDVIDLIDEKHTGIIPILTDQCRTPRGTDKLFAEAMYKACGDHARFEANDLQRGQRKFAIQHYAGPVVYEVEGFLEKNKDEIPRGATNLLESSTKPFVQLLGKINDVSAVGASPGSSLSKSGRSKRPTVGGQFAAQLTELRKRIDQTDPHYIRCLKPNEHLAPNDFNEVMIADQLRYAGVLEAIRVSRVGYPQRYTHELLLQRYHFVATDAIRGAGDKQIDVLVDAIAKKIWTIENPNKPM
jgi:myosin-5